MEPHTNSCPPPTPANPSAPAGRRAGPRRPELLAPAGNWACARAAVENGADAIYFGLGRHNARMRADNFTESDLAPLMEFLHRRGVKGYVTFNTLVFAGEMAEAERLLRGLIAAGVDAAVVQDVGICRLLRRLSPDFPIHASTQMTITSAAGMDFARELGCDLVVLARECSVRDIETIRSAPATASSNPAQLPVEVFVHGALCVAYSGQCLTSESLGGRSANRGVCAQACRLPYDLICDGQLVPLGGRRYLLSPRDLAGLAVLPELVRAGVASLKIEGRLKSPEYVANITRIYRQALDRLETAGTAEERASAAGIPDARTQYEMEMAFSRGLHTGWLRGVNNQELVHARFGKKRGVFLGEVTAVQGQTVRVRLEGPLKPGDGVVFDAGRPEEPEEGGRVYSVDPGAPSPARRAPSPLLGRRESTLTFGRGDIDFRRVQTGDKLWKTSDPELERRLRQSYAGDQPRHRRPVRIEVRGRMGEPLRLAAGDDAGHTVELRSAMPLARAEKRPLTTARLREQLGRLGGTPFCLDELDNRLEGEVLLPLSELNRLRREMVRHLEALRAEPPRWTLTATAAAGDSATEVAVPSAGGTKTAGASASQPPAPELIVLVRSLPQLAAALRCGIRTIYCEFEDPKKYRDAVTSVRGAQGCGEPDEPTAHARRALEIFVAPPRIFKPGEDWILRQVRSSEADGYLVRNYDHLKFYAGCRCVGDYSLNVANSLSAEYFMCRYGLERVTASYDLNVAQLEALVRTAPPEWFEVTLHQHIPMFHMEHCVFCAFLSTGTDYTNCGRPCDRHAVQVRDRVGAAHPLKADAGCRNTVFNARAQTGAESAAPLVDLGVRRFRLEFLEEAPDLVARTIACYRQLLRGEFSGTQLWRDLKLFNHLGVTRGPLEMAGGVTAGMD